MGKYIYRQLKTNFERKEARNHTKFSFGDLTNVSLEVETRLIENIGEAPKTTAGRYFFNLSEPNGDVNW